MPPAQFSGPTLGPSQWVNMPPRHIAAPATIMGRAGAAPYIGRTPAQVDAEGRAQAARSQDIAREATRQWKPNARPEDFFWVWNSDRTYRMLLTFATIDTFNDGGVWHTDEAGIAYYVRGRANN
jgi:hypothetical protein